MHYKPIQVQIKRFDTDLPLPARHSKGAAAWDLYARVAMTIEPGQVGYIPLNVAVALPDGYWLMVAARSSTHKMGLMLGNSIGIIDYDFRGDNDEINLIAYNFTDKPVVIERGCRMAQMLVLPQFAIDFKEVDHLSESDRGWLGSTGKHVSSSDDTTSKIKK